MIQINAILSANLVCGEALILPAWYCHFVCCSNLHAFGCLVRARSLESCFATKSQAAVSLGDNCTICSRNLLCFDDIQLDGQHFCIYIDATALSIDYGAAVGVEALARHERTILARKEDEARCYLTWLSGAAHRCATELLHGLGSHRRRNQRGPDYRDTVSTHVMIAKRGVSHTRARAHAVHTDALSDLLI